MGFQKTDDVVFKIILAKIALSVNFFRQKPSKKRPPGMNGKAFQ